MPLVSRTPTHRIYKRVYDGDHKTYVVVITFHLPYTSVESRFVQGSHPVHKVCIVRTCTSNALKGQEYKNSLTYLLKKTKCFE